MAQDNDGEPPEATAESAPSPDRSSRILVPVGESPTFRNTVAYAVREAQAEAAESGEAATVHFVYPAVRRAVEEPWSTESDAAEDLLERVGVWVREDLSADEDGPDEGHPSVDIETAVIGADRYLFNPGDYADVLAEYADEHGLPRVVVDPEYQPGGRAPMLRPLEFNLRRADLAVEEAPVERQTRRARLLSRGNVAQLLATFGASFLFYLIIGGTASAFDLGTGLVSAGITAIVFYRISFRHTPRFTTTVRRLARFVVYVPYLLWEIAKANVQIAYVVLHPRLPIDPKIVSLEAAVWDDFAVTTLANSITLTPGTLTVDVTRREFRVHALTESSRRDLFDGALERAVRYVFYGRQAAHIPSPAERRRDEGGDET